MEKLQKIEYARAGLLLVSICIMGYPKVLAIRSFVEFTLSGFCIYVVCALWYNVYKGINHFLFNKKETKYQERRNDLLKRLK